MVPVVIFLVGLFLFDARRLVTFRRVLWALMVGGLCAGVSFLVNNVLLGWTGLSMLGFAVLVAPVVEEGLKAIYCRWLVRTQRVGFLVDGAILGFAVGAGFALVENVYYLNQLDRPDFLVWFVRGLGTAMMHGCASAVFTVLLQGLVQAGSRRRFGGVALSCAILIHAGFNSLMIYPVQVTLGVLVIMPLVMVMVYHLGERRLRTWLGDGMDQDIALLALMQSGGVDSSPLGTYLRNLKTHFRARDVVDMLCLLRLQVELNLMVRGGMLLREHGLKSEVPEDLGDRLAEVTHLQDSLGAVGLLALRPMSRWESRQPWQWYLLQQWSRQRRL